MSSNDLKKLFVKKNYEKNQFGIIFAFKVAGACKAAPAL